MSQISSFQIGCDPEFFVRKEGKPFAAIDLVPGNKEAPYKVEAGAVQVDGLALEINTNPVPADDFKAFNANILSVLRTTHSMVKAIDIENKSKRYHFNFGYICSSVEDKII